MASLNQNKLIIQPCLWYDSNAEEAARYYTSVFKNSKIETITYYGEGMPMPKGMVLTVEFTIEGQKFLALNGGPIYKFSEAVSFIVNCDNQEEIDYYWDKLRDPQIPGQCGWIKDKFGLSWQIVPNNISELMSSQNDERSTRVMQAINTMEKLDMAELQAAYDSV